MIAYLDLPLRGQSTVTGHEVMVVAFFLAQHQAGNYGGVTLKLITVDEDGSLGEGTLSDVKLNWRFDNKSRRWLDVDTGDELGSDEDDGESPD